MYVTTSHHAGPADHARAASLAARWGWTPVPAGTAAPGPCVVVTRAGLVLRAGGRDLRWHEGMIAARRAAGARHPWVARTGLAQGDRVLDATLGLGTDARFLAEWTGTRVAGVEVVPALAEMAREGLAAVRADVQVIVGDSADVLAGAPDDSWDLVVADPLFPEREGAVTPGLAGVRHAGDPRPVDGAWRDDALRVARKALVIRDLWGNDLLERLRAPEIHGRRDRAARYGVWRLR